MKKAALRAASLRTWAKKSKECGRVVRVRKRSWPAVFSSSRRAMLSSWQFFFSCLRDSSRKPKTMTGGRKANPMGSE
jgi:hypothetical protein